ncbi:hypothetical protein [Demequina iriomotensis]|uniref:hypothetical protein n=1 Tax=Demequina iriomotensis TaxID=1536641 RepID=UPI0007865EA2|nr:hypothetical protein [Demequina iriomotensis]
MKQTFTTRLPIKASRSVRRAMVERAQVDGRVVDGLLDALAASGRPVNDPGLHEFAISALNALAALDGADDAWVSDHITCVYRALQDYRDTLRTLDSKGFPHPTHDQVRLALEKVRRAQYTYALIDRKSAFGVDWRIIEEGLLALIADGDEPVHADIRNIGEVEIRGAGPRTLGTEAFIKRIHVEVRGDRRYLTAVVQHKTDAEPARPNREFAGLVRVAATRATIVADDRGISVSAMVDEGRSIKELVAKSRTPHGDGVQHMRLSRKMMDARNNYFRQYAVKVARYAEANNLAVEIAFHEGNTRGNPKILGMNTRLRRMLTEEIFRQSRKRGVVFRFARTAAEVGFHPCAHPEDVVVGGLVGATVHGMCGDCASQLAVA